MASISAGVSAPSSPTSRSRQQHHRHGVIDQRDVDALNRFAALSCRKQRAGLAASRIAKAQADRRGGAIHAVDGRIAFIFDKAARRLDDSFHKARRVAVEDADFRLPVFRAHKAGLDGERSDSGKHVSAIGSGVDDRLVDGDLRKQVFDVCVRPVGFGDNGDLARQRIGAADPVHLQLMRRTHHRKQKLVARRRCRRQVALEEEWPRDVPPRIITQGTRLTRLGRSFAARITDDAVFVSILFMRYENRNSSLP